MTLEQFIKLSLAEDTGSGDHTSLSCIPDGAVGKANLLVKDHGVLAGVELAEMIFNIVDPSLVFAKNLSDGTVVEPGMSAFTISGDDRAILKGERLVLNCMQRMSGIATTTRKYVDKLKGYNTKVLDTRKTTPLMRDLEKWAVRIGGGMNHRMGLYDMILVKDNHVDYAGGIKPAIRNVVAYLERTKLKIPVEIETRNLEEVKAVLEEGNVNRIMLDNFSYDMLKQAIALIGNRYETEASGGITLDTVEEFAKTGVDFVSVGALTHSIKSLDLSLKAIK